MCTPFTIFGGYGFIGGAVSALLEQQGHPVHRVGRENWPPADAKLGNVIFTVGMTADFRKRLVETFELQFLRLHQALTRYSYDSFLYLSSARVYGGTQSTGEESAVLVRPLERDHVYNLSKLAAESLCLAHANPAIRVARLSNVFGPNDTSNLFLTAVLREAITTGSVAIGQAPTSSKDYIAVDDVARTLINIVQHGRYRLYNVASGRNVTHREIADILQAAGYTVQFLDDDGQRIEFPPIDVSRIIDEFGVVPRDPREDIKSVLTQLEESRSRRAAE